MHFRPEFLNRVDEVIVFKHLTVDDLKNVKVADIGVLRSGHLARVGHVFRPQEIIEPTICFL